MDLFFAFIIALAVTTVLIPPLRRVAERFHVLDEPSTRKVHTHPVPRIGGLAMFVGAIIPAWLWLDATPQLITFTAAAAVLLVLGAADDRYDLDYRVKFAGQIIAVGLVVFVGDVRIETFTLDARQPIPDWLSGPLTVLFLLGVTNAINLADGLDGLAGGTTLLCLGAIGLIAFAGGNLYVCTLAAAIAGAILGFLRFNTYPARIFMGDAGSQFLGFSVGVLSVLTTQDPATPVSAGLPLLLLGLPIIDTLLVMMQRIIDHRSPFVADRNHIHHRLLGLGLEHHEAVVLIYLLQCALFLSAYFLRFESDVLIVTVFCTLTLCAMVLLYVARRRAWRWRHPQAGGRRSLITRQIKWLRAPERVPRWTFLFLAWCVPTYSLYVISHASGVTTDLGVLALSLLAFGAVLLPWMWSRDLGWLERGVIYVAAALVVYLDQTSVTDASVWRLAFFGLVAAAVIVNLRLSGERRFEVNPLDVLVLFIALVIPNLPGSLGLPPGLALGIGKLIVLLYAIEMLLSARLHWNVPRAVVGLVLTALILRSLLPVL
ncbi:MAG TPA: MraY family glycosyltransferase [Steroidobacteraceae bacterium]|nr:MraY family glycosyltransferase [Steroidobacteraceae bacterium]